MERICTFRLILKSFELPLKLYKLLGRALFNFSGPSGGANEREDVSLLWIFDGCWAANL